MQIHQKRVLLFLLFISCLFSQKATAQLSVGIGHHSIFPRILYWERFYQGVDVRFGFHLSNKVSLINSYSYFPNMEINYTTTQGFVLNLEGHYQFNKQSNLKFYGILGTGLLILKDNNDTQIAPSLSLGVGIGCPINQKIGFFFESGLLYIVPEIIFGTYYLF